MPVSEQNKTLPNLGADIHETDTKVAVMPEQDGDPMWSLIQRMASDPRIDLDRVERVIAMRDEMEKRAAEKAFNAAMAAAQREMSPVSLDASNPQTKSRYASFANLDRALRPIYTKHGFALSFDETESQKPESVRMICIVSHMDGHSRVYHRDMDVSGKGARGGDVMTKTHAIGAAQSYAMRYILRGIFNVATGEDDKDGNDTGMAINDQQREELSSLIDSTGANEAKFMEFFNIEFLADLPARRFAEAKAMLQRKKPKDGE